MTLDARHRSSIDEKFVPLLGEDDANALMTEFPSIEAGELVTKQYLRAELAELRTELAERLHQQTVWLLGAIATATAVIAALNTLV